MLCVVRRPRAPSSLRARPGALVGPRRAARLASSLGALLSVGALLSLGALAGAACDGRGVLELRYPPDAAAGGNLPVPDAGADAGGGGQGGGGAPIGGAAPSVVRLGLLALPESEPAQGVALELAALEAEALGVRAALVRRTFADLTTPSGAVSEAALAALEDEIQEHAKDGRAVMLEVALVRRLRDGRPAELVAKGWDPNYVVQPYLSLLKAVVERVGSKVSVLSLGHALDAWLDEHPDDADGLGACALAALGKIQVLPGPRPLVGVGLRAQAFDDALGSGAAVALADSVASLSEVLVVSYLAGVDDAPASPSSALQLIDQRGGQKPLAFDAVGAATPPGGALTEEQAASLLELFFDNVTARSARVPFVQVVQLGDLEGAACDGLAETLGLPLEGELASALCATGLRGLDGTTKKTFAPVLDALARFSK